MTEHCCPPLPRRDAKTIVSRRVFSILRTAACALVLSAGASAEESPAITINVGVRDDAKPFSYMDITRASETILPGFGGYSVEVCRHVLKQMQTLPRYRNFAFKAVTIRPKDRFKQLGVDGKLFMLCGPDSITMERLLDYRSTHAVFLSGMTYAYVNPRSPKFPRGNYCSSVIGVVRGTTADTEGLADIASRDLLMRFDEALDLELFKTSGRVARTRAVLQRLVTETVDAAQVELDELNSRALQGTLSEDDAMLRWKRKSEIPVVDAMLRDTDPGNLDKALDELEDSRIGLAGKIKDRMHKEHQIINEDVAKEIVTDECPRGFLSLPVYKFEEHDEGIDAFCKGKVLYYLADYDILKNKTQEIADCDIVMNRFTRSREVYGVYFPKSDTFHADPDSKPESLVDAAAFYADFNNLLLMAMQGEISDIEAIFEDEFGVQQKSEELERFFDSFKIESP